VSKNTGVKLHHSDYRNALLAIEDPAHPYPEGYLYPCPQCGIEHGCKTFHVILDENGDGEVAEVVYFYLQENGLMRDLKAVEEVEPTPQVIGVGGMFQPEPTAVSNTTGLIKLDGIVQG